MERWIDFSKLPAKSIIKNGKTQKIVDWKNSVGCDVKFKYGDLEDTIKIVKYSNGRVTIFNHKYGEKNMHVSNMVTCSLGKYLKKYTSEYKIEDGVRLTDNGRDITIIDRKIKITDIVRYDKIRMKERKIKKKDKYYKYHCNIDGFESWIVESNLQKGVGCSLCCGLSVVEGVNDIATTRPDLLDNFIDIDIAKTISQKSHKRYLFKCSICGNKKQMRVADLANKGFSCPRCSDGASYPEKLMYAVLFQLGIKFIHQLTSVDLEWIGKYRYDFYIPEEDCIIEIHGDQHYNLKDNFSRNNDIDEIENDRMKKELADKNKVRKYIVVDARKSELEWIKKNILSSELSEMYVLSEIDWIKCEKDARGSRVYDVCKIKKENPSMVSTEISALTGIERSVVVDYLKRGSKIGWCEYSPKEEMRKSAARNRPRKPLVVKSLHGDVLGRYPSAMALERISEEEYGFKMHFSMTLARVNPNSKFYGKPYHEYIIEEDKKG